MQSIFEKKYFKSAHEYVYDFNYLITIKVNSYNK